MAAATSKKTSSTIISALSLRPQFGSILRRLDTERRTLIIEKRGTPTAVLMDIRDYVKLAAPEPEVLKLIGEEAARKGKNRISQKDIDQLIKETRASKKRR
jgi:prevent-host-death family protein